MAEPSVKIGVLLGRVPDRIGEWLADAAAFDAAGADALWVDLGPEPQLDVLALAAALSVVTFRARLVVSAPQEPAPARTLDTVGRLSHRRLVLVSGQDALELPGDDGPERWETVAAPHGRQDWRQLCADAGERGVRGLVVPADQRLLDILRNPDDPEERRDLYLAQG